MQVNYIYQLMVAVMMLVDILTEQVSMIYHVGRMREYTEFRNKGRSKSHDLWQQMERVFEWSVDAQAHSNYHIAHFLTKCDCCYRRYLHRSLICRIVLYAVSNGGM